MSEFDGLWKHKNTQDPLQWQNNQLDDEGHFMEEEEENWKVALHPVSTSTQTLGWFLLSLDHQRRVLPLATELRLLFKEFLIGPPVSGIYVALCMVKSKSLDQDDAGLNPSFGSMSKL